MTAEDMKPEGRIDQYLLGQATAEDVEVLNELLAKDEELRKLYRFRVALDGGYREAAIRGENTEPMADVSSANAETKQVSRKSFLYGFAVAAVSLAAVALFAIAQWSPTDRDTSPSGDFAASGIPVARLVTSVDADWRDIEPMSGELLEAGSFRLDAGTVELEFNRGARVTLQGPSDFELKSTDLLHVSSGNLVARIPEEAIGFTITTDEAEVVDLGTEFGLRVGDGGQTEVHVIEGLVEVFEREGSSTRSGESIRIEEGQAIRLKVGAADELGSENIPVRSSRGVLGNRNRSDLGLTFLQGNIRLKETVSRKDLKRQAASWIEVIPEKSNVLLDQEIPVTLISAGNYRFFGNTGLTVPQGVKVDSYLFHFRSAQPEPIRGVIKFDRKIVGVVCEASQLIASDSTLGLPGVEYPVAANPYRGLDPHVSTDNSESTEGGGWSPDEVTMSQDMKTLGLSVNVNPVRGVDQLRVLVLSKD
ncbi:FecR protein [Thalassoglobus neptunius]|uniref:FecR protein n=1 Tax=Thalassoglobus neptunius TaxID=1938619 RepID=A0A5C5X6P0_9PLAN|nr:FecR domain-containing protein [Thalassoglobus neptunius]TWT58319.1 FecR protein [Thalassoglobus neptunius]